MPLKGAVSAGAVGETSKLNGRDREEIDLPKYRQEELEHIQQAYVTGRELADAGMIEDAIPYFDQVLGRLPRRRRDRVYRVGESLRADVDDIFWLPTVFRDALLAKASCLNEMGQFDDAFALLKRAREIDPENPRVYAEIGFTCGSRDDLEQARAAYCTAIELEPDNPAHFRALAHLALQVDEFDEARTLAQRAVELEPANISALHHLAYAEYRLGNLGIAIRVLEKAVSLDTADLDSALRLAGTLREAGRLREAIACMNIYLQHDLDNPEALGMMTDLLQQDGMAPELMPHVERLLERNPRDPIGHELLAWGYFQQGKTDEAVATLRRLVTIEPMQPYYHFKLGMLYQALGNLPLAMASLMRVIALDGDGDIGRMALEAISNLDQVQIEQLLARAGTDPTFRYRLQQQPEATLNQSGYLLSPFGLQMLHTLDFDREIEAAREMRPHTIN
ncbi:MAG: tetratricopeptide repeat protein [Armatimonadota bacterium]